MILRHNMTLLRHLLRPHHPPKNQTTTPPAHPSPRAYPGAKACVCGEIHTSRQHHEHTHAELLQPPTSVT